MTTCQKYNKPFLDSSDLHRKLYDGLKKEYGVTDAEFDTGYHVIDYTRPGEEPRVIGAGDCTIDPKELEEFKDNWGLYCLIVDGKYDCKKPTDPLNDKNRDHITTAIKTLGKALQKLNIEPRSGMNMGAH